MSVSEKAAASTRVPASPTRHRWVVLVLLVLATFTNYLDRAVLAVVGPTLQKEFGISDVQYGWLTSAFVWGIVIVILFFGALMQRFGERLIGGIGLIGFSFITAVTGFTGGFTSLLICRVGLGVFEAPTFPMNSTLVRRWFPQRERGKSVSAYQFGATAGTAFGIPIVGLVAHYGGWRAAFWVAGCWGMLIGLAWFLVVRNTPRESKFVNELELSHIEQDGEKKSVGQKFNRADLRYVLTDRRLVSLYIVTAATSTAFFFFMTWLPKYMKESMGIDVTGGLSSGLRGTIPYVCALVGIVFGGWLGDYLIGRGIRPGIARKWPIGMGLAGTAILFVMPFSHSAGSAMVIICVAYFAASMANCAWVLPSEVSRKNVAAMTNSVYGFFTNLFGALSPVVAGYLVTALGYNAMLIYIGVWAVIGLAALLFMLDDVAPTPEPGELAVETV